jgi:hypothetical protein
LPSLIDYRARGAAVAQIYMAAEKLFSAAM